MDISLDLLHFDSNCIYFCSPVPNSVINNGVFNRIYYSTDIFSMNGINVFCKLEHYKIEKYYNKYKLWFSIEKNMSLIEKLQILEKKILSKMNIVNKTPIYSLDEHLRLGNIKINNYIKHVDGLCLKISGIWQTSTNYGITFRFQLCEKIAIHPSKHISN